MSEDKQQEKIPLDELKGLKAHLYGGNLTLEDVIWWFEAVHDSESIESYVLDALKELKEILDNRSDN